MSEAPAPAAEVRSVPLPPQATVAERETFEGGQAIMAEIVLGARRVAAAIEAGDAA